MALYDYETTVYLGWGHSGGVSNTGIGQIELSDEDVVLLVRLIKENDTGDFRKLKLSRRYPKLYNKLRRKYRELAIEAERHHWLIDGLSEGEYEYDEGTLMEYCLKNCGFTLSEDYYDCDGELNEEYLDDALDEFQLWFSHYLRDLNNKDAGYLLCEVGGIEMHFDEIDFCNDYSTELPEAITKLAGLTK